jgi:hypothetical protein
MTCLYILPKTSRVLDTVQNIYMSERKLGWDWRQPQLLELYANLYGGRLMYQRNGKCELKEAWDIALPRAVSAHEAPPPLGRHRLLQ